MLLWSLSGNGAKLFFQLLLRFGEELKLHLGQFARFGTFTLLKHNLAVGFIQFAPDAIEIGALRLGRGTRFGCSVTPAAGFRQLVSRKADAADETNQQKESSGHFLNPVSALNCSSALKTMGQ